MNAAQVSIRFNSDVTLEFRVPLASGPDAKAEAREWLDRTYEEFGCEPTRILGKVLVLDKVLGIAEAAGEKHFQSDAAWAAKYAQAVTTVLDRPHIRVDVEDRTVSS